MEPNRPRPSRPQREEKIRRIVFKAPLKMGFKGFKNTNLQHELGASGHTLQIKTFEDVLGSQKG